MQYKRIGLQEPTERRVVIARIVKVQARRVVTLTGELEARRRGAGGVARSTPRMIPQFRRCASGSIVSFGGRSQVIAEQEIHRPRIARAHRHPLTIRVVVLDYRTRAAGPLEVGADVVGGHAAHYGFDAVAVAVVDEAGAGCAAHGRQAVFGILDRVEPVL